MINFKKQKREVKYDENRAMATNETQLVNLTARLSEMERYCQTLTEKISNIRINPLLDQAPIERLEDISTRYNSANDISLEVFKALPTFDGKQSEYRAWREDASRLMKDINQFRTHSRYSEALSIIKSKIRGQASDILINNNTPFNFEAIRNRLDYTYADMRPLYVLQDEMRRITQNRSSLSEYHDRINQALNLITSKIAMSGEQQIAIDAMTRNAKDEAVRIFVAGVTNAFVRSTLYANTLGDLEHAYAIARTIEHDNQHQNLRLSYDYGYNHRNHHDIKREQQLNHHPQHNRRPNFIQQKPLFPRNQNQQTNYQQTNYQQPKPVPMETDSRQIVQEHRKTNSPYNSQNQPFANNQPWKREHSGNYYTNKQQRINHLQQEDNSSMYPEQEQTVNNLRLDHLN